MKNLLLIITALAIVGSSCSSKIGITKRKYGKGYYVSVSHKPKHSISKSERFTAQQSPEKDKVNQMVVPVPAKSDNNPISTATETHKALTLGTRVEQNLNQPQENSLEANGSSASRTTSNKKMKVLDSLMLSKNSRADDTNTILLVILCLFWFLNLIAVYLKQGKTITNDFWITLILDITFILGVIYSILVVLDVLSFA